VASSICGPPMWTLLRAGLVAPRILFSLEKFYTPNDKKMKCVVCLRESS
jgi:hypothetical protein